MTSSLRRLLASLPALPILLTLAASPAGAQDKWYDRIRFSGDFRLRSETFSQGDEPGRSRVRIRLRAGITTELSSAFSLGVRLASGEPGNITSANVTLGEAFSQKDFTLDRAWLTWKPTSSLAITGGKFGVTDWVPEGELESELIFDSEVPPEGFNQRWTAYRAESGVLRRLVLNAGQWVFREQSRSKDSWVLNGQAVAELAVGSGTLSVGAAYYDWVNGRVMAQARNGNSQLLVMNSVITRGGQIVEGGRPLSPSSADPFDLFVNDFNIANVGIGYLAPSLGGRPFAIYADLARNTATGDRSSAVWTGASWGETRAAGDWVVGAAWARIEQEAVLSMTAFSDHGLGGTNTQGPILRFGWRPAREFTLQVTHFLATQPHEVAGRSTEPLHRLQVDGRVSF